MINKHFSLEYIGSDLVINWLSILFLLSLSQLIIVAFFVKNNSFVETVEGLSGKANKKFREYKSFFDDHFYWFWNLYPIVFYIHFFYLESSWSNWMYRLFMIDSNGKVAILYNTYFQSDISKYIDIVVLLVWGIVSYYSSILAQNKKHDLMIKEENIIYWWSSIYSPFIYQSRKAFLFINLVLLGFMTYTIFKIAIFLFHVMIVGDLNVFPFHVDGYGGLKVIMEVMSIIIAMFLLRSAMGVIGLNDHKGQGNGHRAVDLYNISYFFIVIFVFVFLYNICSRLLTNAEVKYNMAAILSHDTYSLFIKGISQQVQNPAELLKSLDQFNTYYTETILNYNHFSLDIPIFYNTFFAVAAPIAAWFLVKYLGENK